jgi:serine/threonine protein kinase
MVACRARLETLPGDAMGLLHSLVAIDPAERPTMKEVILSDLFLHLRSEREAEEAKNTKAFTIYQCEEENMLLDV